MEPMLRFIGRALLRWCGHVMRMEENQTPEKDYKWTPAGEKSTVKTTKEMERRNGPSSGSQRRDAGTHRVQLYLNRKKWRTFSELHD